MIAERSPFSRIEPLSGTYAPDSGPRPHVAARGTPASVAYSFVIPLKDEEATIAELHARIAAEMGDVDDYELIFVDDGSRDGSWGEIRALQARRPGRVRGLRFRRNAGKAAALTAGFRAARGAVIFTLDADLQDDPKEIARFLAKLDEGYDVVSGWKQVRHDPWHKVLPSRVFNRMLSRVSGVALHDHNCGFKCYRAEVAKNLTLFGELHRMVPALAAMDGFKVGEIVVEHHPRQHGVSKYGFERYLRGFTDMLVMGFLRKYRDRPSHFFAGASAACLLLAAVLVATGLVLGLAGHAAAGVATAASGSVALATSALGLLVGLAAEIANRGGLAHGWRLAVVEDTAGPDSPMAHQRPAAAPVQAGFGAPR